jgi:hypothetical protein
MKGKNLVKYAPAVALVLTALPMVAFAAGGQLVSLMDTIGTLVKKAIPILTALALVFFIVGLIRFVIAADEEKRKDGKSMMWWGIIALFVIVSIWGIVNFIGTNLGIDATTTANPPGVSGF